MAKAPSRAPLVVGVGVTLLLLLGVNLMSQKLDSGNKEADDHAEEQKSSAKSDAKAAPQAQPAYGGNDLVALGPNATLGQKDAPTKIVIGYEWTPAVQSNPASVYGAVEQLQKMAPNAEIKVVNRDEDPTAPPGISMAGKTFVPLKADGTLDVQGSGIAALQSATHAAH